VSRGIEGRRVSGGREDEAAGLALMQEAGAAILAGVDRLAARWVVDAVTRVLDAWGRLPPDRRSDVLAEARDAGDTGAGRVHDELETFFATDPVQQRTTPLEIVRSLRREATIVLHAAAIPGVERDAFEVRSFPDDEYGLVPRSLAELGDEDLAPMLMAWGLGKAKVLRARATGAPRNE
jgi:hypothetical protein